MSSTITVPSGIGEASTEVANNAAARGNETYEIANALIDVATAAVTDIEQLQSDVADAQATADAGIGVVHSTTTIAFGDFSALAGGVKTHDYTVTLPSNATLLATPKASDFTGFDDNGGSGTATIVIGTSAGGNQVGTSLNVATGQTGFPKQFTAGANGFPTASLTGATITMRFTSNHDLNTFTAGSVKVHLYYFALA